LDGRLSEAEAAQREWEAIKSTDDRSALTAFIGRYPTSLLAAGEATQRLGVLEHEAKECEQQAAAAPAPRMERCEQGRCRHDQRYRCALAGCAVRRQRQKKGQRVAARGQGAGRESGGGAGLARVEKQQDAAAIRAFIRKDPTTALALNEAKERLDESAAGHFCEPSSADRIETRAGTCGTRSSF
jgi:hypothetical protein